MDSAARLFRFRFQFVQGIPPALILASTDGYSNSFSKPDDFCKVGTDLLGMIQRNGLDHVQDRLAAWLEDASRSGSGDDVSLGIICRRGIAQPEHKEGDVAPEESRAVPATHQPPQPAPPPE